MELSHRCTLSMIANLNKLESFILHDPATQRLYQQYLSLAYPGERKAIHILFFVDMMNLEEENCSKGNATFKAELYMIFEKYFVASSDLLLDISKDRLDQVRRNIQRGWTLSAFKPAIKEVVRDLAFIHMDSFINCPLFKNFKDSILVDADFSTTQQTTLQERDSNHKLRKFFGDKFLHAGSSVKLLGEQPKHIKEYKLSKMFGERVGVEKAALMQDEQVDEEFMTPQTNRRDRRLHIFFGDYFAVEEILFSERIQGSVPRATISSGAAFPKQPEHVSTFRLAKFFGERPPTYEDLFQADLEGSGSEEDLPNEDDVTRRMHSRSQHLMRFFGERMDPSKEAHAVAFASQPEHVKACTLKKIFGESAAHTINFDAEPCGGTWPKAKSQKSRAKLQKFFGPFEA